MATDTPPELRHGLFAPRAADRSLSAADAGDDALDSVDLVLFRLESELASSSSEGGRAERIAAYVARLQGSGISPDQHDHLALHLIDAGVDPATGALVGREAAYVQRFGDRPRNRLVARASTLPELLDVFRADNSAHSAKLIAFLQYSANGAMLPIYVSASPLLRYALAQRLHAFTERLRWLVYGPIDRQLTRVCRVRALLQPPPDLNDAMAAFRALRDQLPNFGLEAPHVLEVAAHMEVAAAAIRQLAAQPPADVIEQLVALIAELPMTKWPIQHATFSVLRTRPLVVADLRAFLSSGDTAATHLPTGLGLQAAALRLRETLHVRAGARFREAADAFAVLRADVEAARDGAALIAALQDWPESTMPGNGHAVARADVLRDLRQLFPVVGPARGSYSNLPTWLRTKVKALLEVRQPIGGAVSTIEAGAVSPAVPVDRSRFEREWADIKEQMQRVIAGAKAQVDPQQGWQPEESVDELVSQFFAGHAVYLREITRTGRLRTDVERIMRAVTALAERYCGAEYWQHSSRNPYTGEPLYARASSDEAHFRLALMVIRQQRGRDPLPGLRLEQMRATVEIMARYFPALTGPLPTGPRPAAALSEAVVRRLYGSAVQALRTAALTQDDPLVRHFWSHALPAEKRAVLKAFFGPFFHLDVDNANPATAYRNAIRVLEAIGAGGCYREVGLTLWLDGSGTVPRLQFRLSVGDPSSVAGEDGEYFWLGHTHPERPKRSLQWPDAPRSGEVGMTILAPAAVLPEEYTGNIFPSYEFPGIMPSGDLDVIQRDVAAYERLSLHRTLGATPFYDPSTDSYSHDVIHCSGRSRVQYFPARVGRAAKMVIPWALNPQRRAAGVALDASWAAHQPMIEAWGRRHGVAIEWKNHVPYEQLQMANRFGPSA